MRSEFLESLQQLVDLGYNIAATPGTAEYYVEHGFTGIVSLEKPTNVVSEDNPNTVVKWIQSKKVDLVINIPEGTTRRDEVTAGYLMRRAAVDFGASLLTNIK